MRSVLAGVVAGIVVSVAIVALVLLSLPRGPVLRPTPPAATIAVPSASPSPSGSRASPTVAASASGSLGAGLRVGDQAPALVVNRLGGGTIDRSTLTGPVWVNFTATWCPTCRDELRMMQRFQSALGSRMTIVVVDVREPAEVVQALVNELSLTLPVGLDSGTAERSWAAYALPVHYWVDGQGRIAGFVYGGAGPDQFLEGVRKVIPDAQVDIGS